MDTYTVNDIVLKRVPSVPCLWVSDTGIVYTSWKMQNIKGRRGFIKVDHGIPVEEKGKRLGNHGYYRVAVRDGNTRQDYLIHRLVVEAWIRPMTDDEEVDHIDNNRLNNTLSNLRIATHQQNCCNAARDNTKYYKGVSYKENRGTFDAKIQFLNETHYLGAFNTAEEAARAYDEAAKKYHGAYANLNFKEQNANG